MKILRILRKIATKINIKVSNKIMYRSLTGRNLNINHPKTFNDKINWLKLYFYPNNQEIIDCADKLKMRSYIEKAGYPELNVEIIGKWDNAADIDWDKLPKKFVLKCNHGSKYNIICKNKDELNKEETVKKLNAWMKEDFGLVSGELHYSRIKRKIFCERYIEGKLIDFQIWCSYGKVFFEVYINSPHGINEKATFDENWNRLDFVTSLPELNSKIERPKKLDEMIKVAKNISKGFPFIRLDFYILENDEFKLSEMTFSPASGFIKWNRKEIDYKLGEQLDITKIRKNNILLVATLDKSGKRLDGETIKNKMLKNYLKSKEEINIEIVDTHDWKKNAIKIIKEILKNYRKTDKIIISASQNGATVFFKFLNAINSRKEIFYFLIGGSLANDINDGKINKKIFKNVNCIYVESDLLKNNLIKLGITNVSVLYNFRNIKQFENKYQKNSILKFVFFGRLIKTKGIEQSIDLVKKLHNEGNLVSLDIYGQCNENYLEYIYKMFNKCEYIKYHGSIIPDGKTEYEVLSQYDVFLLPTEHIGEGLPGALIDAYIAGLAVLVSNWKYAKEYVLNGENGYIFEYQNYEDMYVKSKFFFNEKKLESCKKKSKELSEKFYIENVLNDFLKELKK